jgi:hypothetical protein
MNKFETPLVIIIEEAGNYTYGFNKKTSTESFQCLHPEKSEEYYKLLEKCREIVKFELINE